MLKFQGMIVVKGYRHITELVFIPQNIVCYADFQNLADLLWLSKQSHLPLFLRCLDSLHCIHCSHIMMAVI